jgi:cell division protein FtsW (lipid II flippase)
MKLALPLVLAMYFQRRQRTLGWRDYAVAAVLIALPTWLIIKQPDLGTALLVTASGVYVIFLAGLSWKIIAGGSALILAGLPILWGAMRDYQRRRFLTLIDPSSDPLGRIPHHPVHHRRGIRRLQRQGLAVTRRRTSSSSRSAPRISSSPSIPRSSV